MFISIKLYSKSRNYFWIENTAFYVIFVCILYLSARQRAKSVKLKKNSLIGSSQFMTEANLNKWRGSTGTGSCSTFEFPSRVNLSRPSLYCTWLYEKGLAGATRLTRSDFMLHAGWIYFYQRGRFAWTQTKIYLFCGRYKV